MRLCGLGLVVLVTAALPLFGQKGPKRLWIRPSDQLVGFNGQLPYAATLAFFRGTGQQGGERDVSTDITWSSSNPNLVAIDPHTGVATSGGASGTVTITALSRPFKASARLTVGPPILSSIAVGPNHPSVSLGGSVQFNAIGTYSDSNQRDLTDSVTWSSGKPKVATISNLGLATARTSGDAIVSATFGAVTGASTLTVLPLPPTPVTGHPRILITATDLPRLPALAVSTNPMYAQGIQKIAIRAKSDMDSNQIVCTTTISETINFCETTAELFAFMSLVDPVSAEAADYAQRARTILMDRLVPPLLQGPHDPAFIADNRSRCTGEAYFTTVHWIYPSLTASDKGKLLQLYIIWT